MGKTIPIYVHPRHGEACDWCKGQGIGAYLTDASGLDDHCPACNGSGRIGAGEEPVGEVGFDEEFRLWHWLAYKEYAPGGLPVIGSEDTPEAAALALRCAVLGIMLEQDESGRWAICFEPMEYDTGFNTYDTANAAIEAALAARAARGGRTG